ncbi:MAG: prolyl oligopeptidase family serine peptidase, partial [Planctomycetaceae bacterium]|nr:prolyl oligopeptidase family serine peptidase [Planctomycetaceae bacterium]
MFLTLRRGADYFLIAVAFLAAASPTVAADPPSLSETRIVSTIDGIEQPVRYWAPDTATEESTPVLVSLHTWSSDYTQDRSEWYHEAFKRGWIYLQPNFRGANDHPEACGSPLARQDILDALDWAIAKYQVDPQRIYLSGVSGGGHMSLLMAARHPERFSAVSAWVGITDLTKWYEFHTKDGEPGRYAQMVAASCGGPP